MPSSSPKIILSILIILLVKYFIISFFIHPVADDFIYAHKMQNFSISENLVNEYKTWNGRYSANFLVLLNPIAFNSFDFYKAIPIIIICLTVFAFFYFLKTLTNKLFSKQTYLIIALAFTLLYLYQMPDLSEGIYWFTGAVTYHIANILSLIFFSLLYIFLLNSNNTFPKKAFLFFSLIILLFFIMGLNEIHVILFVSFFIILTVISYLNRFKKTFKISMFFLSLSVIFALFVILAPGNSVRAANFEEVNYISAFLSSCLQTIRFFVNWINSLPLIIISLVYLFFHTKITEKSKLFASSFYLNPYVSICILLFIIFIGAFPAYWGTGILGQHRTMNVSYFFFLIMWIINLNVFFNKVVKINTIQPSNIKSIYAAILLIGFSLSTAFTKNGYDITYDLYSSNIVSFDKQMKNRYLKFQSDCDTIYFSPISNPPKSIFIYDVSKDPNNWLNQSYSLYFTNNNKTIKLRD